MEFTPRVMVYYVILCWGIAITYKNRPQSIVGMRPIMKRYLFVSTQTMPQ